VQAGRWEWHVRETLGIAAPIALALLAEMMMGLISTVTLGSLGDQALAAGGLGTNLFFTTLVVLQGVLAGVGVLAASALGAGRPADVAGIYWSGILLGSLLATPLFIALSLPGPVLRALGEPEALTESVSGFLRVLRWAVPAGVVGFGMMRQFLPAIGLQKMLLWVLPGGIALHLAMNLVLVRGAFGFGGFGLNGSAAATAITLWAMSGAMLVLLHRPRNGRLVRLTQPHPATLRRLLALGLPSGGAVAVEGGLFLATGLLASRLGPQVLAAHLIALSVITVVFMIPLSISQAANVRVATANGAGRRDVARRAGFCAIALAAGFMACVAIGLRLAPHAIIRLYLGPTTPATAATEALAVTLLGIAGVFQIADGTQVAASGALRGLQDVRVPMVLAAIGYWGVGFSAGWLLAFPAHLGAVGLWWGLCAGLAAVALCLTLRFAQRSRVTQAEPARDVVKA